MISKDDVKRLGDLARIELSDAEQEKLALEMESILGYVGQVKEVAGQAQETGDGFESSQDRNVMREDTDPTPSGTYSADLIAGFPDRDQDYLKVKKIL